MSRPTQVYIVQMDIGSGEDGERVWDNRAVYLTVEHAQTQMDQFIAETGGQIAYRIDSVNFFPGV